MRFISLKSIICDAFASVVDSDLLKGNKVVFLTSAGFVAGNPCPKEIPDSEFTLRAYKDLLDGASELLIKEQKLSGYSQAPNDEYILLKDVEIHPYGQSDSTYLSAIVLFTSDIAGAFLSPTRTEQG